MVRSDGNKAKEIGQRIVQGRAEAGGMSQRELADLLGVSERSVIAYEKGEVIPWRFFERLQDALGKPSAWLIHGEDALVARDDEIAGQLSRLETRVEEVAQQLGILVSSLERSKRTRSA